MKFELKPNQFHPEVYDLTVYTDTYPIIDKKPICVDGDTTYWYGENADGFVGFGISYDYRVFNHEPGYMWASRSSVFNGLFPDKCFCKEVTVVCDGHRNGCYAMTVESIIKLLGNDYELFVLTKDGEINVEIGDAYQILTDDIIGSHGECIDTLLCGC